MKLVIAGASGFIGSCSFNDFGSVVMRLYCSAVNLVPGSWS
jgi:hypothetical protein